MNPHPGDFVGIRQSDRAELFIIAVDTEARTVKIGRAAEDGPWLTETQARAQYNYEWGKQTPLPIHWQLAIRAGEFEI